MTTIGIIGGGQLAKMLIESSSRLSETNRFIVLTPAESCCVEGLADKIIYGSLHDEEKIRELCTQADIVTYEIENIGTETLLATDTTVVPAVTVLETIKDKRRQKKYYTTNSTPTVPYYIPETGGVEELRNGIEHLGNEQQVILKVACGGYDGRGVYLFGTDKLDDFLTGPYQSCIDNGDYLLEKYIHSRRELAVIVAFSHNGSSATYDPVDIHMRDGILEHLVAPSQLSEQIQSRARDIAVHACTPFGRGLYAVEMFATDDNQIYVNEISPRPHNSGHHTIEGAICSQYEMLLRILLDLPLGDTSLKGSCVMKNILGHHDITAPVFDGVGARVYYHDYGKTDVRPQRKLGHITYFRPTETPPRVGVIMGSINDNAHLKDLYETLDHLKITYEAHVVSAHRTPRRMMEYAQTAEQRGLQVIIAAAGGAAHLPGMTASETNLPVIAVPIKSSALSGLDSLLSIVQMPRGIPVGTMAINGGKNAALYAAKILSLQDPALRGRLNLFYREMHDLVLESDSELQAQSV